MYHGWPAMPRVTIASVRNAECDPSSRSNFPHHVYSGMIADRDGCGRNFAVLDRIKREGLRWVKEGASISYGVATRTGAAVPLPRRWSGNYRRLLSRAESADSLVPDPLAHEASAPVLGRPVAPT